MAATARRNGTILVGLVGAMLTAAGPAVGAAYLGAAGGSFSFGIVRWAAA